MVVVRYRVVEKPHPLGATRNKTQYKLFRKRTKRLHPFNADNRASVKLFMIYFIGFVILYYMPIVNPKTMIST